VKFEEINLKFEISSKKFKKVQDPHSMTTVIERHSVGLLSTRGVATFSALGDEQ